MGIMTCYRLTICLITAGPYHLISYIRMLFFYMSIYRLTTFELNPVRYTGNGLYV